MNPTKICYHSVKLSLKMCIQHYIHSKQSTYHLRWFKLNEPITLLNKHQYLENNDKWFLTLPLCLKISSNNRNTESPSPSNANTVLKSKLLNEFNGRTFLSRTEQITSSCRSRFPRITISPLTISYSSSNNGIEWANIFCGSPSRSASPEPPAQCPKRSSCR